MGKQQEALSPPCKDLVLQLEISLCLTVGGTIERFIMEERGEKVRRGIKLRYKVTGIVAPVLAGLFVFSIMRGKSQLEKKLNEVRAAGFPVTPAELDAWYSIPKGAENAADIYIEAFEKYAIPESLKVLPVVGDLDTPKRDERLSPETIKVIEKYLADNKETLDMLYQAAKIEHCRYPIDLSGGIMANFGFLGDIKKCAMFLSLKIMFESEHGGGRSTSEDIEALIALANSCEDAPLQIYQLVRIACLGLTTASVEYALNRVQFNDEQLERIIGLFTDTLKSDGMYRAIAGERALLIDYMLDPGKYPAMGGSNSIGMKLYSASGLKNPGLIEYIDISNKYMEAFRLPVHERSGAVERIAEKDQLAWYHVYLQSYGYIPVRLNELELRYIAHLRVCCVSLVVERYRLAEGKLPDSLDQVVPRFMGVVPLDPYDGKPIRYKQLDKGYVVYSIGEDCVDNGGTERSEKNRIKQYDITFTVERQ